MNIRLHANATTTPKTRAYIRNSKKSDRALARELGISLDTVRKWRRRETAGDRSHTPHKLQTTLSPVQESIVVELRKMLLLPLDDLLVVTREFINPNVSRSALDRCLRRHGVSRLCDLLLEDTEGKPVKTFKDYEPGFVHVDYKYLPQMADETSRRYLFVAIDRATRWVYIEFRNDKSVRAAKGFFKRLIAAAPFRVTKVLTDNDKAFTDRLFGNKQRQPSGEHPFDKLCAEHSIEHRLIPPGHPQTNGMVERFNGRIADVIKTTRFSSAADLERTLTRYAHLYNQHIPQKALQHRTPVNSLKDWQQHRPELFRKLVRNHPGPDT